METTTLVDPLGETTPAIDRLVERPIATKEHVEIEIGADNDIRIETERLEASLPPMSQFLGLPDSQPETVRTVWEDGRMRSYSAGGELLYDEAQPLHVSSALIGTADRIIASGRYEREEAIRGLLVGRGAGDIAEWDKYIDSTGTELVSRGGGMSTATVRNFVTEEMATPVDGVVLFRDRNGDRQVVGVRIYRAGTSELLTTVMYSYGDPVDGQQPLEMVQNVIRVELPASEPVQVTTVRRIEDFTMHIQ